MVFVNRLKLLVTRNSYLSVLKVTILECHLCSKGLFTLSVSVNAAMSLAISL